MIINEASVRDLRGKLPEESICTPLQFRPNFVATGNELKPYEEDEWKWVRIGDQAIFQCVKPCTRYDFRLFIVYCTLLCIKLLFFLGVYLQTLIPIVEFLVRIMNL
jgi:hypothetical protein